MIEREDIPLEVVGNGYFAGWSSTLTPARATDFVLTGNPTYPDPASRFQPEGPQGWRAAAQQLAHLRDMGIPVLEVMPAHEFPADSSAGAMTALIYGHRLGSTERPMISAGSQPLHERFLEKRFKRRNAPQVIPGRIEPQRMDGDAGGNGEEMSKCRDGLLILTDRCVNLRQIDESLCAEERILA